MSKQMKKKWGRPMLRVLTRREGQQERVLLFCKTMGTPAAQMGADVRQTSCFATWYTEVCASTCAATDPS